MKKLSDMITATKETFNKVADHENTRAALEWSKEAGKKVLAESEKLGKEMIESDLGKASAKGAAMGAIAAVPIPLIGPIAGAMIGAGAGAWAHLQYGVGKSETVSKEDAGQESQQTLALIAQLDELRQKGAITSDEYSAKKDALLKRI